MTLAPYLLATCLLALVPQQPSEPESPTVSPVAGPSQQFVAYNRFSTLGVADQGTQWLHPFALVQAKLNGRFPIKESQQKLAQRFTIPAGLEPNRSVDALWLYYRTVGDPGAFSVSLRETDPETGGPALTGTTDVPFFPHPAAPTAGWHRIALPQSYALAPGEVYQVLVQSLEGAVGTANRLEFVHLRARMPVPFLPFDGSGPEAALRTPFDADLGSVINGSYKCDWLHWQGPVKNYVPIFLIEHDSDSDPGTHADSKLFGQPYDTHIEQPIADTQMYGQALAVPEGVDLDVNYLAMFVRGAGQPGLVSCDTAPAPCNDRPCGDLLLEVYEEGSASPLVSEVLIEGKLSGGLNPIFRARSHWFGLFLDQTLTLAGGKLYYLMLSSPRSGDANTLDCHDAGGDGWDAWVFSAQSSHLAAPPFTANDLPTYMATDSYAVSATRTSGPNDPPSAGSFAPLDEFRADAGFLLGNFPTQRPIAILDESSGKSLVCKTFSNRAVADEPLQNIGATRNIGTNAGTGSLFARVLDGTTLLDTVYYPATLQNEEASASTTALLATLEFAMPNTPTARFTLEYGWVDPGLPPGSNHIVDDRIPAHTRRTQCCVCAQQSALCEPPGGSSQKP